MVLVTSIVRISRWLRARVAQFFAPNDGFFSEESYSDDDDDDDDLAYGAYSSPVSDYPIPEHSAAAHSKPKRKTSRKETALQQAATQATGQEVTSAPSPTRITNLEIVIQLLPQELQDLIFEHFLRADLRTFPEIFPSPPVSLRVCHETRERIVDQYFAVIFFYEYDLQRREMISVAAKSC